MAIDDCVRMPVSPTYSQTAAVRSIALPHLSCIQLNRVCRRIVQSVQSFATFAVGEVLSIRKLLIQKEYMNYVRRREIGRSRACKTGNGDLPNAFMPVDLSQRLFIAAEDLPTEEVIFGGAAAMREVRKGIERATRDGLPVLIQGESGTGKEVIAKYLHLRWASAGAPFIKMSCVAFRPSALPAHEEQSSSTELLQIADEEASGGTLFLDEIGDMDWKLQEELIDLLSKQDGKESAGRRSMRIVCSTRIGVEPTAAEAPQEEGRLVRLRLPALREREQDIPQLCEFLMQKQANRFGRKAQSLTPHTVRLLQRWQWPGNLRELENWVARVVILESQEKLAEELRCQSVLDGTPPVSSPPKERVGVETQQAVTQAAILRMLEAHGWSRRRAARELKMSYSALLGRLHETSRPRKRPNHRGSPPMG